MTDDLLLRRIAETIGWCAPRASVDAAETCLRSSDLRPDIVFRKEDGFIDYRWGTPEQTSSVVEALAQTRSWLLRSAGVISSAGIPSLAGGRLLVVVPEESDWSGLSEHESRGFLDVCDIPPWDTWLCYVRDVSYLLCWVPPVFVPLVDDGIKANPVDCIFWASDFKRLGYLPASIRQLEVLRLL